MYFYRITEDKSLINRLKKLLDNGTSEDDEKAADKWSGETLITSEEFEAFRRGRDY